MFFTNPPNPLCQGGGAKDLGFKKEVGHTELQTQEVVKDFLKIMRFFAGLDCATGSE